MRILISSGGTKIPIDPVRNISNLSTGLFGSQLAKVALENHFEVIYLTSQDGKSPFSQTGNFYHSHWSCIYSALVDLFKFSQQYQKYYKEFRYTYFLEYSFLLKKLIIEEKPDVVILAAAVSDYLISNYSEDKIRSAEDYIIKLKPAPKIIQQVKGWAPYVFLVGFKLLINANDEELLRAAKKTLELTNSDIVVANNLASIQNNAHEIMIVEKSGTFNKYKEKLPEQLILNIKRALSK